jgi:D-tyrosyl-tRNA(Tyr) deacylase
MRAVLQRVDHATVHVAHSRIAAIRQGVLVFLGIERGDQEADAAYLCEKISHLRIFEDDNGKMNRSVIDISGEMLVISQFTLLADCRKGRRPSFTGAEDPDRAKILYEYFLAQAKTRIGRVRQGEFQAMMQIELVNNGPVTMLLDSKRCF